MANEPYSVLLTEATYFCGLCQVTHSYTSGIEFDTHRDLRTEPVAWVYKQVSNDD